MVSTCQAVFFARSNPSMAPDESLQQVKPVPSAVHPSPVAAIMKPKLSPRNKWREKEIKVTGSIKYDTKAKNWSFTGSWTFPSSLSEPLAFQYVSAMQDAPSGSEIPEPENSHPINNSSENVNPNGKLNLPNSSTWSGTFANIVRKRKSNSLQHIAEKFEMHLHTVQSSEFKVSCLGRNRFGKFSLCGILSKSTGNFSGVKSYVSIPSLRGMDEEKTIRQSKRTPRPNKMIFFETCENVYSISPRKRNRPRHEPRVEVPRCLGEKRPVENRVKSEKGIITEGRTPKRKRMSKKERARMKIKKFIRSIGSASNTRKRKRSNTPISPQNKADYDKLRKLMVEYSEFENTTPLETMLKRGEVFKGLVNKSARSGYGICAFANGLIYEGGWYQGKMSGKGVVTDDKGSIIYQGEFLDGRMQGVGTFFFSNGDRYDGEWKESLFHGFGSYVELAGTVYEGEWNKGTRSGLGRLTFSNGSYYDGEWNNNFPNGCGELFVFPCFRFNGQMKNGEIEGKGSAHYHDGSAYEGGFRNSCRDGRGTYTFANGTRYEGRFRMNEMHGSGFVEMSSSYPVTVDKNLVVVPIKSQADIRYVHFKAGFGKDGL